MSKYDNTLNNTKVTDADEHDVKHLIKDGKVLAKTGDEFLDVNKQTLTLKNMDLHFMRFEVNGKQEHRQTVHFIENELGLTSK